MNVSKELYKKKTDTIAAAASMPHSKLTLKISSSTRKKEIISPCDTRQVKGSPATLAKLMTKHKKKEKQLEQLKQQLSKTKEEEIEIRKTINTLVALHCDDETGSRSSLDEILLDDCTTSRGISDVFNEAIILPALSMPTSFEACMG